ncbi:MAG TPA: PPC domain-containing protein, partial [Anaerolineales bacterium]|nr:PPC domain-containing protein [Anaerolineales bacterium]
MNTKIPRTLFPNAKIQPLSISNFLWILAGVLIIGQLQFGTTPASASAQLWTHRIASNTLLEPYPVCPPTISFGETIQCSISSAGEIDTYTFDAVAGDKVLVRMSKSSGNIWSEINVYSPGGTGLCEDYIPATAEIISCNLPSTGTYSILAFDHLGDYTGDYYLYLQRLNNPGSPVP